VPNPTQVELEPDTAPEWSTNNVVDAGTRSTPMVRQLSVQEILDKQAEEQANQTDTGSVQKYLDDHADISEGTTMVGTGSEETDRYAAAVFGALGSLKAGVDPYDGISDEMDKLSTSPTAGSDIYHKVTQDTDEIVRSSFEAAGFAAPDAESFAAAYKQIQKFYNDMRSPWGFESYLETTMNGLVALNSQKGQEILQERTFQDYGMSLAAKKFEGKNWLGRKGWDFAKLMVLPGTTIAMGNYVDKFDPGTFGTISNALGETVGRITDFSIQGKGYKAYQQAVEEFWKRPVEERLMMLPQIHEQMDQIAGGNMFVYMGMMMPFVDRQEIKSVNFDYNVDTASILSMVPGTQIYKIAKFARNVSNFRKPVSLLIQTGNVDKAAALINRALKDTTDKARRVTGMSRDEVAWSAYPLDVTEHGVPGQIQGAAAEAAKQLEDEILSAQNTVNKTFQDITDPSKTPLRHYFDEAAVKAKQRQVLGELNDYPNTAKIIHSDGTGFTVEVTKGSKYAGTYDAETLRNANAVLAQNVQDTIESLEALRVETTKAAGLREAAAFRKGKAKSVDKIAEEADEAFAKSDEAERLRAQLIGQKEQIRRNERIIKDLEKPPVVEKVPVKYTFKEDGTLDVEEVSTFTMPSIASPSQVVDQLLKGTTDQATLAEFIETKILNTLHETNRQLIRGLTGRELKDIDKLLLHGDEQGRVFSLQELINGVDTRFGQVKLKSTKAIAAYAGIRRNFDEIHRIKNYLRIRDLERGGFKQLKLKILNDSGQPFKVFAKEAAERKSIPSGVTRIYDHKAGEVVNVTDIEDLGKRLDGEWSVVQFRHGFRAGDEVSNYGLVRFEKDMKPISGQVLDFRPGYVPRTRPGVFYIVPKRVTRTVDGVKTESYQTERFFSTKAEAYEYYAGAKDPDLLPPEPDKRYRSPTHDSFDDEWDNLNFGGLYTGERTDRTILMGIDGKQAQRTSAYKALSTYMAHIANRYSTNELKSNLISRFQHTYGKYLAKNGVDWQAEIVVDDLKLKQSIEAARTYIKDLIRMPDPFQNWWSQKMRSLAEAMEPVPVLKGAPREWVMNFASRDPTAFLRATSFHMYLGMFNPAQWLVQGMGMATALAAYPGKALKIFPKNLALRAAWLAKDNPEAIAKIANAVGVNGDELADIVNEIHRVGLFDSLKTSADYNATIHGISPSADAMRRTSDAGLFFFREGEQWTRGYGYLLARDLFLKGKKKGYKLTEKDMDFIAADSMRFTLNLNRSNRAAWQKGVLSIPTQFWQVMTKFTENLVGGTFGYGVRKWTPAEKTKIMAGYLGMFGMAGIPFMDSFVNTAVETRRQATDDPTAMTNNRLNIFNGVGLKDEDFARLVRGGLVQAMAHWLTGSDPELSTRFSIPAGVQESWDMYAHGDRDIADALMGAAGPGIMRWYDALVATRQILGPLDWDTVSSEQFRQIALEFAKIYSTSRNAEKAEWWHHMGKITNSKGQNLMDMANMSDEEFDSIKLWQVLGFGPSKVGWMYDLEKKTNDPLEQRVSSRVDAMLTIWNRFAPDQNALDTEQKRAALNQYFAVAQEGLTEEERKKFMKKFMDKVLAKDKSQLTKVLDNAIKNTANAGGVSTSGALANPLMP
jgi:hypothetical protein